MLLSFVDPQDFRAGPERTWINGRECESVLSVRASPDTVRTRHHTYALPSDYFGYIDYHALSR